MDATFGYGRRSLGRGRLWAAMTLLALLTVACGIADPVEPPENLVKYQPPQAPSRVTVRVATTGAAFDPDGFNVLLDGDSVATVDVNGVAVLLVQPGTHRFELGAVAPNCSTTGTVTVSVPVNLSRVVRLSASCVAPGELPAMRILVERPGGLFEMSTDGTTRVVLPADGTIALPDVTSDGRRIAYIQKSPAAFSGELWVADVDGGNRTRLTTGAAVAAPHWSPDGEQIAYVDDGVRLIRADGSLRSLLLSGDVFGDWTFFSAPTWSPDGTRVAVSGVTFDGRHLGVVVASLDGALSFLNAAVLPHGGLAWSVDDRIAYVAEDGALETIRPDGTAETTLLAGGEGASAHLHDWSPGGAWLLYTDRNPFDGTDLYLLSPTDGLPIRVTATGDIASAVFLPEVSP